MKNNSHHLARALVAIIVAVFAVSCVQAQTFVSGAPPVVDSRVTPPSATARATEYLIGPDDVLKVSILDVPEISGEFRVSNTGSVTLPVLAHPLVAEGLTLSQFSDLLANELKTAGLVSDPHVSTSVDQSRIHSVAITGAVRHPQVYTLLSQTTLLDVLSQCEGLADDASGTAVVSRGEIGMQAVERAKGNDDATAPSQTVTVDVKRLLETGDPKLNVAVYPGDRITVPHAGIVYVVGAVNKPGGFTMKPSGHGMTVLQALALAEDTKGTAKRNQTVIIRNDKQSPDGRKQIPVQLKSVLEGKSPDPVLQAEDILFVPDSAGKHALHRGVDAVIAATTGVAIYRGR